MEQEIKNSNGLKNNFQSSQMPEAQNKKETFFKEIIKFALLAIIIVLPIRFFIAQPFIVSGRSMDTTFANGQYLIVDRISYRFEDPKRGDVIIFKYPLNTKKYFIKRIVGLPSETLEIIGSKITIKNGTDENTFSLKESYINPAKYISDRISIKLKDDEYFVMGDNRTESLDSRIWGPLKSSLIIGKPFLRLFPVNTIGIFPGANIPETISVNTNDD